MAVSVQPLITCSKRKIGSAKWSRWLKGSEEWTRSISVSGRVRGKPAAADRPTGIGIHTDVFPWSHLDVLFDFSRLLRLGNLKLISGLQIHPNLRGGAEVPSQTKHSVCGDAAFPGHNAVDPVGIDIECFGQLVLDSNPKVP